MEKPKETKEQIKAEETLAEDVMYAEDTIVEKLPGNFLEKSLFIEPKVVTLWGVGKNKFGRHVIEIESDGDLGILPINDNNRNSLVNFFGSTVKGWMGKKIRIKATYREFDRLSPGYTLSIEKAE